MYFGICMSCDSRPCTFVRNYSFLTACRQMMVRKIGAGSEGILGGDTVCSVKRPNMQSGKLLGRIGFVVGFTGAVLFYLGPQWSVLCLPCPIVHPIPSTGLVSLQIALTTGLLQGLLFALLGLAIGFLLRAQAFEGGTESNPGYPIVKSRFGAERFGISGGGTATDDNCGRYHRGKRGNFNDLA
jgi:hypothetical protein